MGVLATIVPAAVAVCVAAGCGPAGTLLTIDAYSANREPASAFAYCYVVGADGLRRHGERREWSQSPLPQSLGLKAEGRTTATVRFDELYRGLPRASSSATLDLAMPNTTLEIDACRANTVRGAFRLRKQATAPSGAKLARVRSGAEAAGGAELVAIGSDKSWRAVVPKLANDDGSNQLAVIAMNGVGHAVNQVITHDTDSDCADDLLVAAADIGTAVWPSGNDGNLTPTDTRVRPTPAATSIAIGDLDNNGYADLALVADEGLLVVLANDKGVYGREVNLAVEPQVPTPAKAIAIGDLNLDDRLDSLIATNGGPLYFLAGENSGKFASAIPVTEMLDVSAIALRDVDGDGDLDAVVAAHATTPGIRVLINDGIGLTGELVDRSSTLVPTDVPNDASGLLFADVDGDCRSELVVWGPAGPPAIYNVASNGALTRREVLGTVPAQSLVVGDLDGDGSVEISFASVNQVYVWSRTP